MRLLALLLPVAASLASAQKVGGVCYPITSATVADSLRANGVGVNSSQVRLPMKLTASVPAPQFEIVATRRVNDQEIRLELRCHGIDVCLPFDALVGVADANAVTVKMQPLRPGGGSTRGAGPRSEIANDASRPDVKDGTAPQLRVGMQAVLVIEDGCMQIHFPVIAIDSGSLGSLVRVSTLDRKKTFRALVIGDGVVRGVIE